MEDFIVYGGYSDGGQAEIAGEEKQEEESAWTWIRIRNSGGGSAKWEELSLTCKGNSDMHCWRNRSDDDLAQGVMSVVSPCRR